MKYGLELCSTLLDKGLALTDIDMYGTTTSKGIEYAILKLKAALVKQLEIEKAKEAKNKMAKKKPSKKKC